MTVTVPPLDHLIKITDAATRYHRSPATIRRWVTDGELQGWRVRSTLMVVEADLAAMLTPRPVSA